MDTTSVANSPIDAPEPKSALHNVEDSVSPPATGNEIDDSREEDDSWEEGVEGVDWVWCWDDDILFPQDGERDALTVPGVPTGFDLCSKCESTCCRDAGQVLISDADVSRLAYGLGMDEKDVREKYVLDATSEFQNQDAYGDGIIITGQLKRGPAGFCIFSKDPHGGPFNCGIHKFRPYVCAGYNLDHCRRDHFYERAVINILWGKMPPIVVVINTLEQTGHTDLARKLRIKVFQDDIRIPMAYWLPRIFTQVWMLLRGNVDEIKRIYALDSEMTHTPEFLAVVDKMAIDDELESWRESLKLLTTLVPAESRCGQIAAELLGVLGMPEEEAEEVPIVPPPTSADPT